MTERPPRSLKNFANNLARLAFSDVGLQMNRLLRLTGLTRQASGRAAGESLTDNIGRSAKKAVPQGGACDPFRVGIWERKENEGEICFVRSMDKINEWNYWANVARIRPKGTKLRVVLIGESVARGFLYDPEFTPAKALEMTLGFHLGKEKVEVIDLARTNLGFEVAELARSALLLEPDAVIIFSGNNFCLSIPTRAPEVTYMGAALRERGIPGLKQYAEDQLAAKVRVLVKEIASFYEEKGVPLVWVLPEFNLGHWRDPVTNAPHLPGDANREWISLRARAERALSEGELGKAAALAESMVELDSGVSVAGLYILAECSQRTGDMIAARRYLEAARDAVIWDPSRGISPRPYDVVQEAIREEIGKHRSELVDLPGIFKEYLRGALPDRRLFLDYCHLTTEGIQIAMAAAASRVLLRLKGKEVPWRELVDNRVAPSREVEAGAAFLAAVHNAHWWQSYDSVHYHCLRALQSSTEIAQVMAHFLDIQTRRTPMLMCRSAEQIAASGSRLIHHYLLRHNDQRLDSLLLDAVVCSLKEARIEDLSERLDHLRREEHSVSGGPTNLLNFYYASAARQPQEVMWVVPREDVVSRLNGSNYYKAYWLESRFIFVGEAYQPVQLRLTCRLPHLAASQASIFIEVNGHRQGEAVISRRWGTWEITTAGDVVCDGLNEVVIRWPIPEFPGEKALERVVNDLSENRLPEFFCVFGEIHSFTVSDGRNAQSITPLIAREPSAIGVH